MVWGFGLSPTGASYCRGAGKEGGGGRVERYRRGVVDDIESGECTCDTNLAHAVKVDEGGLGEDGIGEEGEES